MRARTDRRDRAARRLRPRRSPYDGCSPRPYLMPDPCAGRHAGLRAVHSACMAKRDPRDVLGIEQGASPTQIKAAWRRLARANHPDLTGDDPAASRLATRRMAEINDAYAALTRNADRPTRNGSAGRDDTPFEPGVAHRRGGPPAPKPTRPVTGRVDMSGVYQPRNQAVGNGAGRTPLRGQPPKATDVVGREAPRASTPTGPTTRGRLRHFRRPPAPSLADAEATVITVRQVPRSHARADRGLRAVVHRLGRGHRQSRSGPGECRAGHPGRSRPTRHRPQDPPDSGPARPLRLIGIVRKPAGKARSPPDTGRRP